MISLYLKQENDPSVQAKIVSTINSVISQSKEIFDKLKAIDFLRLIQGLLFGTEAENIQLYTKIYFLICNLVESKFVVKKDLAVFQVFAKNLREIENVNLQTMLDRFKRLK